jgi:hypothetical protein
MAIQNPDKTVKIATPNDPAKKSIPQCPKNISKKAIALKI